MTVDLMLRWENRGYQEENWKERTPEDVGWGKMGTVVVVVVVVVVDSDMTRD
jgi:hypothetical protein